MSGNKDSDYVEYTRLLKATVLSLRKKIGAERILVVSNYCQEDQWEVMASDPNTKNLKFEPSAINNIPACKDVLNGKLVVYTDGFGEKYDLSPIMGNDTKCVGQMGIPLFSYEGKKTIGALFSFFSEEIKDVDSKLYEIKKYYINLERLLNRLLLSGEPKRNDIRRRNFENYCARLSSDFGWWTMSNVDNRIRLDDDLMNLLEKEEPCDMVIGELQNFLVRGVSRNWFTKKMENLGFDYFGFSGNYNVRTLSGEVFGARNVGMTIEINGLIIGSLGYFNKILSHKNFDDKGLDENSKFGQFFKETHANFLQIDPQNLQIVNCNVAAEKFYGYSSFMFRDLTLMDLETLNDEELQEVVQILLQKKTIRYEGKHRVHNGLSREVEVLFSIIEEEDGLSIFAIVNDITERVIYERQLRKSIKETEDIRNALNQSVIMSVTDEKGKIISVNNVFCEISRFTEEELVGADHKLINSGYHSAAFMRDLWLTVKGGNIWRGEVRNRAKDGRIFWLDTTIVPIFDNRGFPKQYISIRKDISSRKKAEALLKKEREQTLKARFEGEEQEKDRISKELHDGLGQILTASNLSLAAVLGNDTLDEKVRSQLIDIKELIKEAAIETKRISRSLLPRVLDDYGLVVAIHRILEDITNALQIETSLIVDPKFVLPEKDKNTVYRIIQEAINNAVKHSNCKSINITFEVEDNYNIYTIQDDGIGFVAEIYKEGFGLQNMKQRASVVKGSIDFESIPNKGTKVTFKQKIE